LEAGVITGVKRNRITQADRAIAGDSDPTSNASLS
jgi:hypothetical protein